MAVLGLAPVVGCNRQPAAAPGGATPAAPQITVVKPEMRPIKRVVEQPGTVQAFEETALFAKLPGYVGVIADDPHKKDRPPHDRQIDIGSRVKKDQVLAELTVPELEQELKQKQALVEQAEAEVVQAEKALAAAGAAVESAKALVTEAEAGVERAQAVYERWQLEVNRVSKLVTGGVDTNQVRDETQLQLKAAGSARNEANAKVISAQAAVTKAEADRDKSAADVKAAKARVEVARAEVGRVEALRTYTKIKAPFDGVVTRRAANTGDLVSPGEKVALFNVARTNPVRVVVNVPEADAELVAVGLDVRVTLQAAQGPAENGKVARMSWSLEPGSRTLRTEIDLPNEKGLIRPGMYVNARLTVELPASWTVPAPAVGKVGDESVIYLAEGGKAVRVSVQLGRGDGQFTQVRRYKRPGAAGWTDVTGSESVATPAAVLTDGQPIP
ncbi:MAG TPA: efflux RND transporter periplasmic adaptor subunit [Gemmataceae bacterium]|nr:efflux RND transporter periplasmic adaptor subunit [Gemmataceae bacterium]